MIFNLECYNGTIALTKVCVDFITGAHNGRPILRECPYLSCSFIMSGTKGGPHGRHSPGRQPPPEPPLFSPLCRPTEPPPPSIHFYYARIMDRLFSQIIEIPYQISRCRIRSIHSCEISFHLSEGLTMGVCAFGSTLPERQTMPSMGQTCQCGP